MKIKFKKFEPTRTFLKLFGGNREKTGSNVERERQADAGYEYYYKRGNTYYFRNNEGEKISIDYTEPQQELVRGNRYDIDAISYRNR